MQVGLGRDLKLFNGEGVEQHVFVGAGKFFLYCGMYHVQRVDRLTKEEWKILPPKVREIATRRSHRIYSLLASLGKTDVFRDDSEEGAHEGVDRQAAVEYDQVCGTGPRDVQQRRAPSPPCPPSLQGVRQGVLPGTRAREPAVLG